MNQLKYCLNHFLIPSLSIGPMMLLSLRSPLQSHQLSWWNPDCSLKDKNKVRTTIPPVFQCLDVEAQSRGNGVNVFTIEFLQDGCLPCIIQATALG